MESTSTGKDSYWGQIYVRGVPLQRVEMLPCGPVKPGFHGKPQDVEDARYRGYLPRRATNWLWNQPKKQKCVAVNKCKWSWRSEDHFNIRRGDAEHGVCPANFLYCLSPVFPHYAPFSPFWMAMYIRCHCIWKYVICFWIVILQGVKFKRLPSVSEEILNFELLNSVETVIDYGDFWACTECNFALRYSDKSMGTRERNMAV